MSAKGYLSQIRKLSHKIEAMQEERDQIWIDISSAGTSAITDTRVMGGKKRMPEDMYVKYQALCDKITAHIDILIQKRIHIVEQIYELDNSVHSHILYRHYVQRMPFVRIAALLHYSEDRIYHLHQEALREFGQMYPEDVSRYKDYGKTKDSNL